MTITFEGIEFDHADKALQHYDASGYGDRVISLDGKYYVTKRAERENDIADPVRGAHQHAGLVSHWRPPITRSAEVEEREIIVGHSNRGRLLVVSFTVREGAVRLITARMATKAERLEYEEDSIG